MVVGDFENKIFIGTMSGTSLDGLDICAVTFKEKSFEIIAAETFSYSPELFVKLTRAHILSGYDLHQLHVDYGVFCGNCINEFINKFSVKGDYIASHGHTVFHTPQTGVTLQIGSGAHIAAITKIPVICDFRTLDVAHGGQGAPLVPIGDQFLFSQYDYCLNIGGFANVSSVNDDVRIAWDICPANIVLNEFAKKFGKEYDENGELGKKGAIHTQLLSQLDTTFYYSQKPPKSLGREWVEAYIIPILKHYNISDFDKMRTYYEHVAKQIGFVLEGTQTQTLCTGGGTHNMFLMQLISQYSDSKLLIPAPEIVNFKEALIFAYLGYLRVLEKSNCLASVTGANRNVSGGVIWEV